MVTARGCGPGLEGADGGWRGSAEGDGRTKPIWGEVVWGEGFREGRMGAASGAGAAAASALSSLRALRAR